MFLYFSIFLIKTAIFKIRVQLRLFFRTSCTSTKIEEVYLRKCLKQLEADTVLATMVVCM